MKRKSKKKQVRRIRFVIVVCGLLIVFLLVRSFFINNKEVTSSNKETKVLQNQGNGNEDTFEENNESFLEVSDEEKKEINKAIDDFLNVLYKSMKNLKEEDMTKFFSTSSYEEAYVNQTALRILIDSRKGELNDLKMSDVKYDFTIEDISKEGKTIKVSVLEDASYIFNFMKDVTTYSYDLENKFELTKENGEYKINSFFRSQDYYLMTDYLYSYSNSSKDEIEKELDSIRKKYNNEFDKRQKKLSSNYNEYISNKNKKFETCDNKYDRESALKFALKYVKKRTEDYYGEVGGNCQNYASFMLLEGGIPMDTIGDYIWKHYDNYIDETNEAEGRSTSWTVVSNFREYALNNEGFGLCASVGENILYAEAGDIVQVGYDNEYTHTTVVTQAYKKNSKVVDIIVNSNTGDLENFPVSAYVYPLRSLIKILGWNE